MAQFMPHGAISSSGIGFVLFIFRPNMPSRAAFLRDAVDRLVEIIVSGFAWLYPAYELLLDLVHRMMARRCGCMTTAVRLNAGGPHKRGDYQEENRQIDSFAALRAGHAPRSGRRGTTGQGCLGSPIEADAHAFILRFFLALLFD
jgi:hypothetical protein